MVDKAQMVASGMAERVRQEVEIHSRLKHPAILEVLSYFEDNSHVYLVLELAENGELAKYLKESGRVFGESEAKAIFEQVVSGLLYLHGHGIMHRDLTLANLLLTRDMRVKIADFGLATRLTGQPNERHVTMCGTPNYISPEVATRSSHGLEADVWGLGCLLYTMLVGKPPFDTAGVRSTLTKVVMADFSLPSSISTEAADLLRKLLKKNPIERIKLREIPNHPWMKFSCRVEERTQADSGLGFTMTTTAFSSASGARPGPKPVLAYPVLREQSEEMVSDLQHGGSGGHHGVGGNAHYGSNSGLQRGQDGGIRGHPNFGGHNMNTGGHQTSAGVGLQVYMGQGGFQGHQDGLQRVPASSPALLYPPSPPVKMISDPSELPAPLVNHQELPVTSLANQQSFFSRQFSLPEQVQTVSTKKENFKKKISGELSSGTNGGSPPKRCVHEINKHEISSQVGSFEALGICSIFHQSCLQRSQPTSTNTLPPAAWHGKPSRWCQRSPPL